MKEIPNNKFSSIYKGSLNKSQKNNGFNNIMLIKLSPLAQITKRTLGLQIFKVKNIELIRPFILIIIITALVIF